MNEQAHVDEIERVLDEVLGELDARDADNIEEYVPSQRRQAKYAACDERNAAWRKRVEFATTALLGRIEDLKGDIRQMNEVD